MAGEEPMATALSDELALVGDRDGGMILVKGGATFGLTADECEALLRALAHRGVSGPSQVTLTLTPQQVRFIEHICDTWVPSTPSGRTTKTQDRVCDAIIEAIRPVQW